MNGLIIRPYGPFVEYEVSASPTNISNLMTVKEAKTLRATLDEAINQAEQSDKVEIEE